MQWGKIVLQEQEASVVRWIYQTYLSGASYNELVETLRKQTIPYITGKLWNKNMVARILENPKYTGTGGSSAENAGTEGAAPTVWRCSAPLGGAASAGCSERPNHPPETAPLSSL